MHLTVVKIDNTICHIFWVSNELVEDNVGDIESLMNLSEA